MSRKVTVTRCHYVTSRLNCQPIQCRLFFQRYNPKLAIATANKKDDDGNGDGAGDSDLYEDVTRYINAALTGLFSIECLLKIFGFGFRVNSYGIRSLLHSVVFFKPDNVTLASPISRK